MRLLKLTTLLIAIAVVTSISGESENEGGTVQIRLNISELGYIKHLVSFYFYDEATSTLFIPSHKTRSGNSILGRASLPPGKYSLEITVSDLLHYTGTKRDLRKAVRETRRTESLRKTGNPFKYRGDEIGHVSCVRGWRAKGAGWAVSPT